MGRLMQTRSDELSDGNPTASSHPNSHGPNPVGSSRGAEVAPLDQDGTAIAPLAGMATQILLVALFTLFFATLAMSTVTVVKRFVDQARGHAPT